MKGLSDVARIDGDRVWVLEEREWRVDHNPNPLGNRINGFIIGCRKGVDM
jgi:hypothetical protein